jgi:hypothetical protein
VAVFGDLHGRVLLAFHLAQRWEAEHGETLHLALSVGDIGVFRSLRHMEPTSRRWAMKYPEELGFSRFFCKFDLQTRTWSRHPLADEVLDATRVELFFVPGNHEDHAYLDELWTRFAPALDRPLVVDQDWHGLAMGKYSDEDFSGYARVRCLPQWHPVELEGPFNEAAAASRVLKVRALSGVTPGTPEDAWSRSYGDEVLLTHETFKGRLRGCDATHRRDDYGSQALRDHLMATAPAFHFFGHHHWYYPEVAIQNEQGTITRSIGLNQVFFRDQESTITQHCFGILRIAPDGAKRFEIVEDDWFAKLRYADCARYL